MDGKLNLSVTKKELALLARVLASHSRKAQDRGDAADYAQIRGLYAKTMDLQNTQVGTKQNISPLQEILSQLAEESVAPRPADFN